MSYSPLIMRALAGSKEALGFTQILCLVRSEKPRATKRTVRVDLDRLVIIGTVAEDTAPGLAAYSIARRP